jgi:glycosyltransferase involved in cell wall biosynthesis
MDSKCVYFPHPPAHGGPGTFQIKLEEYLKNRGWDVCYTDKNKNIKIIIVIGGTKKVFTLLKYKFKGIKIIHRLDGLLYLSRYKKHSLFNVIKLKLINYLLNFIRIKLANYVVYQSIFVKNWWVKKYGSAKVPEIIIYNGSSANLSKHSLCLNDQISIICVEGTLPDDLYVINLIKYISNLVINGKKVKISLIGIYSKYLYNSLNFSDNIFFHGHVSRGMIESLLFQNDIFLSLDLNAACPNSAIEASHIGLPVIGFRTGGLPELLDKELSRLLVSFKGNSFNHNYLGDYKEFKNVIEIITSKYKYYSDLSLCYAKINLSNEKMFDDYYKILTQAQHE